MSGFGIERFNAEIVSHSRLALIRQVPYRQTDLGPLLQQKILHRHGISNRDTLYSYIGMFCLYNSDCDQEPARKRFFLLRTGP